jgi:hypothetical protein
VRLAARGCVWSEGGVRVADPNKNGSGVGYFSGNMELIML